MDPKFRDNYYAARRASDTYKSVNAEYATNVLAAVWTPASGKKFRLKGGCIQAVCTVLCNGSEAAGNQLILCDSVVTAPIVMISALISDDIAAGSMFPGFQGHDAAVLAATSFQTTGNGPLLFSLNEGYLSSAADNVLKFGLSDGSAAVTVGAGGKIRLVGVVWGTEE